MKVLVVSNEQRSISALINFLTGSRIAAQSVSLGEFNYLLDNDLGYFDTVKAIVLDRIYLSVKNFPIPLKKLDYFFIIDDWKKVDLLGDENSRFTYRCYFWPLNYPMLVDDIKSITGLKQYMDFGSLELDGVELDLNRRSLRNKENEINLCNKEFELLLYLAKNRGKVLSRVNILENVWDMNANVMTNTVDVHVSKLRKILKDQFGLKTLIRTVPCSGYILN